MDVKNSLVSNINNINSYTKIENNTSEYGSSALGMEFNNTEVVSVDIKSNLGSDSFDKSTEKDEYTQKELDNALKKINNFLKDEKTHAEYSRHEDFGTLMIKIVDDETGDVLLEVPPKKILDMVASMCKQVGLLDKKA